MNIFTTDLPLASVACFDSQKHPGRTFIFKAFVWSVLLTPLSFGFAWYSEATDEIDPPTGERMFPPGNIPLFLCDTAEAFLFCLFFVPLFLFVSRLLMFGLRRLLYFWNQQNKPSPLEQAARELVSLHQWFILFILTLALMALSVVGFWIFHFFY